MMTAEADMRRREFLLYASSLGSSAALALGPAAALASARPCKAKLARPKFYWGVGIENCWIAQTDPVKDGNRRLLDVFLQMQHYEKWKEDLDRVAEVGANTIRYSVPWYIAEPKPGVYDWSWIDKPIDYLVNKLKIVPIMDLVHYGTPKWMADGVIDERFPEAIAEYAHAMAMHFRGLVNHYTPHNEPQITALLCGLKGTWPPYQRSIESWARIGVRVAKGIVLETQAIRGALPGPVIVSVDASVSYFMDQVLSSGSPQDPQNQELRNAAAFYPASLAYGKVRGGHPLAAYLTDHGVAPMDLEWFQKRTQVPDILGYNKYPAIQLPARAGDSGKKDASRLRDAARRAADEVKNGLRNAQAYFQLPVYLTETSSGLTPEVRVAYIHALSEMVRELRQEQVPIVGLNWWPLFETIQWDYRDVVDKPLVSFIRPGGWNNGLWRIEAQSNGDLKRIPTEAAQAYAEVIRRDLKRY